MSGDHDDDIVSAVLAGDLHADDPRVAGLPTPAHARLEEMLRVQRELADTGARERELLGEVESLAKGPVPREVEDFLAKVATGTQRASTETSETAATNGELPAPRILAWRRTAGLVAIAAGLLLLAYAVPFARAPEKASNVGSGTLGTRADVQALDPVGPIDRGDPPAPFRWKGTLPRLAHFQLRVWAHESRDGSKGELLALRELSTTEWLPDVALPDRFHWRVDVVPFEGAALSGPEVEAWRRR